MRNRRSVSDMLVTVKSREIQRAILAQTKRGDTDSVKHSFAAAHLEQVLADDYKEAGQPDIAVEANYAYGLKRRQDGTMSMRLPLAFQNIEGRWYVDELALREQLDKPIPQDDDE